MNKVWSGGAWVIVGGSNDGGLFPMTETIDAPDIGTVDHESNQTETPYNPTGDFTDGTPTVAIT